MDEREFYNESTAAKPARLNCPFCRTMGDYQLRWLVRIKKDRLPPGRAGERERAKFAKAQSYMVLIDDTMRCNQPRCRRTFDISGIKTTVLL